MANSELKQNTHDTMPTHYGYYACIEPHMYEILFERKVFYVVTTYNRLM